MKIHKLIFTISILIFIVHADTIFAQNSPLSVDSVKTKIDKIKLENADSAMVFARKFLGVHYKYAGNSPKTGFDCSGFVNYVFKHYNVTLPRSSKDFDKIGTNVNPDSCLPGDIVLFSRTISNQDKLTGHVGIVIEKNADSFKFIHASTHKGIVIDDFKTEYYQKRFRAIRRVLKVEKIQEPKQK